MVATEGGTGEEGCGTLTPTLPRHPYTHPALEPNSHTHNTQSPHTSTHLAPSHHSLTHQPHANTHPPTITSLLSRTHVILPYATHSPHLIGSKCAPTPTCWCWGVRYNSDAPTTNPYVCEGGYNFRQLKLPCICSSYAHAWMCMYTHVCACMCIDVSKLCCCCFVVVMSTTSNNNNNNNNNKRKQ